MRDEPSSTSAVHRSSSWWAVWTVVAAFGTYFCTYAFRKPFTAASFTGAEIWGMDFKTVAVSTQVLGYMVSKFVGIKVISETAPSRRAITIVLLIGVAELALVGFGAIPRPWNVACLFLNGLMLGMVFGLVLGFLEGRRLTEALTAGLCTSFILADGATKSVGAWLLQQGVAEDWMPGVAGLLFLAPLVLGVIMLSRVPTPTPADVAARAARHLLTRSERRSLYARYAAGLSWLIVMYLLLTIVRSVRADFAPELWRGLGEPAAPSMFTRSELLVALGVLVVNGCAVYVRDNRTAFFASLATCGLGFVILVTTLVGRQVHAIGGFPFMVLAGLGLYLPYVAMHTTVFERLLAMTRERGNLSFLMYVADAFGYLGYVAVMMVRNVVTAGNNFLPFFIGLCWLTAILSLVSLVASWRYFAARQGSQVPSSAAEVAS